MTTAATLSPVCPVCASTRRDAFRKGYARCRSCGLLRNDPFPTADEIAAYYRSKATSGNYSAAIAAFDAQRAGIYRRGIRRLPGDLRGRKILDVGCFTGLSLDVLRDLGAEAYGLEYQAEAAAQAATRHPGRVRVGDVCTGLAFDTLFDAVTMTDVIEHVPDPARALRSVANILCDGGHLLLTTPDTSSWMARGLGGAWPSLCSVHHLHLFNRRNLGRLLEQCGFEVLHVSSLWKWYSLAYVNWIMPNFHPPLARICARVPKFLQRLVLPLNGGEMLVLARKRTVALARAA